MPPRHPFRAWPRQWLMTDERLGDGLWAALRRLPRGSGVVFRHYATPLAERRRMFAKVVHIARARGLLVLRAGGAVLAGEGGRHNDGPRRRQPCSCAVHSHRDLARARRMGAGLVFVSPVFATRSHPWGGSLGVMRAMRLARAAGVPAVALGGVDARRYRRLRGFWGWAAIDAWADRAVRPRQS